MAQLGACRLSFLRRFWQMIGGLETLNKFDDIPWQPTECVQLSTVHHNPLFLPLTWLMDLICHDSTDCRSMLLHKQIAYPVMPNLEFSNFKRFQSPMLSLSPLPSTFWFFPEMAPQLRHWNSSLRTTLLGFPSRGIENVCSRNTCHYSLWRPKPNLSALQLFWFHFGDLLRALQISERSGSVRLWWGRGGCKVLCVKNSLCRERSREANLLAIKDWVQDIGFVYLCLWQGIKLDLLGRNLLESWTLQSEKSFWGKFRKKLVLFLKKNIVK